MKAEREGRCRPSQRLGRGCCAVIALGSLVSASLAWAAPRPEGNGIEATITAAAPLGPPERHVSAAPVSAFVVAQPAGPDLPAFSWLAVLGVGFASLALRRPRRVEALHWETSGEGRLPGRPEST